MSRKHFEAVAASFKNQIELAGSFKLHVDMELRAYKQGVVETTIRLAKDFANIAANDNPRFDTQRFLRACGIN